MKTTNIRYATLLLAAVMSLNMSAQKNVLKAFEKFKNSRVVAITNTVREQGKTSTSDPWRCNIMEFRFFKGDGVLSRMKELQDAFEQDSQDKDVTYYGQMKGLPENASEADKAKYKKTVVRYNDQDGPIVIGENTTYNVLVLRSNSKDHPGNRIVVATEWKVDDHSSYCIGKLYEIEGPKDFVKPAYDIVVESADTAVVDSMYWEESFTTRMTFYRDNFTLMYNPKNTALMTDMFNFIRSRVDGLTDSERSVGRAILDDMAGDRAVSAAALSYLRTIDYCKSVLTPKRAAIDGRLVADRLQSYHQEWKGESSYPEQERILRRMAEYIRAQHDNGMTDETFNWVVKFLGQWKSSCKSYPQKDLISGLLITMERKENGQTITILKSAQ